MPAFAVVGIGLCRPSHSLRVLRAVTNWQFPLADDAQHLQQAADWLRKAQDQGRDGALSGGYSIRCGRWLPPDTFATVLAVRAFSAAATVSGNRDWFQCAATALRSVDSAFGELPDPNGQPAPPQRLRLASEIILASLQLYRAGHEPTDFEPAKRQAGWLLRAVSRERDVSGREEMNPCLLGQAARALLAIGCLTDEKRMLAQGAAITRHLLERAGANAWIPQGKPTVGSAGGEVEVASTSDLATLLEALGDSREHLDGSLRERCAQWVRQAAERLMLRFELNKPRPDMDPLPFPSRIDAKWRCQPSPACHVGTAELALAWLSVFRQTKDIRMVNAALKALDQLKRQQDLVSANQRLRGGIPPSCAIRTSPQALLLCSHATARFLEAMARQEVVFEELEHA